MQSSSSSSEKVLPRPREVMPALWFRWQGSIWKFVLVDVPLFVLATGSMGVFYRHVQKATGNSTRGLWWRMPLLMSVGVGLTITNARAVIEGLLGPTGRFDRTPKTGEVGNRRRPLTWSGSVQISSMVEAICGVYSVAAIAVAAVEGIWMAIPFMSTFAIGYLYLAWQGLLARSR